jgi:hypothetical protein
MVSFVSSNESDVSVTQIPFLDFQKRVLAKGA